ncbi:MAG: VacJ family lipoprotein [Candidatus Binatia bacterium]
MDRRILGFLGSSVLFITLGVGSLGHLGTVGAEEKFFPTELYSIGASGDTSGNKESDFIDQRAVYAVEEGEGSAAEQDAEYDPWEPANDKVFWFNRKVDRYVLKPIAKVWDFLLPDLVQHGIHNVIDNTNVVSRLVNNLAQGKFTGAGRELARFSINSTIGVAGFFDVAKDGFGIEQSQEDAGQTMGVYGVGPGPYLVLPFLPPLTVRDGIGFAVDGAMNPLNYILPYAANADSGTTLGVLLGIGATDAVNDRSLNLERYEGIEETVIDLYGAVRNGYLQRRDAAIKE